MKQNWKSIPRSMSRSIKGAINKTSALFVSLLLAGSGMSSHAETCSGITPATVGHAADSLPNALASGHADLVELALIQEAKQRFSLRQIPDNKPDWEKFRLKTKTEIINKTGIQINHGLPLNIKETVSIPMDGFTIKNISFQTRPGMNATASLYIPDGKGPFPAVLAMHGHWKNGHASEIFQAVASSAALNGYVCLTIDAFGGGERSTVHGQSEYHGNNLGASCMNIGESLMGIQISDNMRAIDLLCSLPYVDSTRIGATGASGGGNQTMWVTAIDDRIKASVPVVSVGTFETYIMKDNCICELLVDGLNFTEESGVLALAAPRAIKMCNHLRDDNPTFAPSEMLRTYQNALATYRMLGAEKNLSYQLFDLPHDYHALDREAMLGWFDLHLKGIGDGSPKKEKPFTLLPEEKLMVFPVGKKDANVLTVAEYCKMRGNALRTAFLSARNINTASKKSELRSVLRIQEWPTLKKTNQYSAIDGWERFSLETSDGKLIPVILSTPSVAGKGYTIFADPQGKKNIDPSLIEEAGRAGSGIVVVDLSGTGENGNSGKVFDEKFSFHTLSRAELWLGKTILGEWAKELHIVSSFINSRYNAPSITIDARGTAALAALFMSASSTAIPGKKNIPGGLVLRDAPVSYLFDNRETVDFFTMASHLPRFLNWGDISLAAALSGNNITFINPLTMSGQKPAVADLNNYRKEFSRMSTLSGSTGKTIFK